MGCLNSIVTFFIVLFPFHGIGLKVYKFHETKELSSASFISGNLPDHFIICSSHNQQQINTPNSRAVYVLYEDPKFMRPWLSIGFYNNNVLWANVKFINWYSFHKEARETFLYWVHICIEVDTKTSTLKASVNGGNVTTVTNVQGLTPAPPLYLRLGVVHIDDSIYGGPDQFVGDVANINIFKFRQGVDERLLMKASSIPFKFVDSFLHLAWSSMKMTIVGKGVKEKDLSEEILFSKTKVLNVRLPLLWSKIDATEECRKYGHGKISTPPDLKNVTHTELENIYGEKYDQCKTKIFWTTFTDEFIEGTFIDEITNEIIRN